MTTRAGLYLRVSTRQQAHEGFSLEEQERVLTALARDRGWDFELYVDAGLSGEGIDHRPALLSLLADAKARKVDVVAVVDESRLARDELSAAVIRHHLRQAGVILATTSGDRDLTDPAGAFVAGVLSLGAAFEQGLRTKKMTAGLQATARAGFWPGGPAPYGYRLQADPAGSKHKVLVIDEAEAAILREAASLILEQGHTTWSATKLLSATGRLTRTGRPWDYRNLAFQLKKPHLTGLYTYEQRAATVTFPIPAVLTESRWEALQAVIRAVPGEKPAVHFYALTGYIRCACGGSISGVYRKEYRARYYKCTRGAAPIPEPERCPHYPRYLPADQLETQVWQAIHSLLTDPDRLRQAAQRHLAAATHAQPQQANQRASIARRLDELDLEETGVIRTHARGPINDTQLTTTLTQIADERTALRTHLNQIDLWEANSRAARAHLEHLQHLAEDARTRLADANPQQQRRIYELLHLTITLAPDRTLGISGTIPTHDTLHPRPDSELPTEAPRDPTPHRASP